MKNVFIPICGSKKRSVVFIICSALSLFVMGMIFYFSAQNRDASQATSDGLLAFIVKTIEDMLLDIVPNVAEVIITFINNSIRRMAHFTIFCFLGFFVFGAMLCLLTPKKLYLKGTFAAIICFLYALSDEIHQIFVFGRSCELGDLIVDFCGAVLGGLLMLLVFIIVKAVLKKKKAK